MSYRQIHVTDSYEIECQHTWPIRFHIEVDGNVEEPDRLALRIEAPKAQSYSPEQFATFIAAAQAALVQGEKLRTSIATSLHREPIT